MIRNNYNFIDLFSGIGGFHIAFHNEGARCVFASECNNFARETYENYFSKIEPNLFKSDNFAGDITKVNAENIPDFDILTGGFPCQAFSQAGHKKGFKDSRGTLFFDIARIIEEKEPKAFFIENVRNLLNHDQGKTFKRIKEIIEKDLKYSFFPEVIKASDFGLPQHRPRLYMVGFKDKEIAFDFPKPTGTELTMSDIFEGKCDKDIGYTLRVGGRSSGIDDRRNWDAYRVDGEIKKITIKEGKRMMGFPDNFPFPVSDTQAMKQLGNSVAIPAVQAVAKQIIKTLNKHY